MLLRCLILLFCICAISGQKGGRRVASESSPVARAAALGRKTIPEASEKIQQVQEPERDPDEDREVVSAVRPTRPQPDDPQEGHAAPEPYNFKYSVDDPESGAQSSREETQDASGEIVGYYHIQDKDGRSRRVDYTAGKDGFKAKIKSNEEGLNSRSPADVDIELSASPSEKVEAFAPNNRPQASESSIKSFGKPPQKKFFERLIPTTTRLPPPPPPPPQEQDTQAYESSNDSDPDPEITQQRNVDEVEPQAFESVKGLPPPPPPRPTTYQPIPAVQTYRPLPTPRPVGTFSPVRNQVYAEQGLVSLQPILGQPQVQTREDIPSNSIQEVQQSLDVPQPPPPPPPSSNYNTPPSQSSVFVYPNRFLSFPRLPPAIPLAPPPVESIQSALQPPRRALSVESFSVPPQPRVEQQQIQYRSSVLQSPPPPPPPASQSGAQVSTPTSNVFFGPQHGQPLTQQQFLQFFQPVQDFSSNFGSTPGQPIVFDATPGRAINLFSAFNDNGQTLMSYVPPQTQGEPTQQTIEGPAGYRLVVQREQDTYQLPAQVTQNPQVIEQSPELYQINHQQVSQQLGQQQGPQQGQQQGQQQFLQQFLQQGLQQGPQQGLQQGQQQYLQQGPQQGLQQDLQQGQQQYLQQGPQQAIQQDLQQGPQQYLQQGPEQGLQQGQQLVPPQIPEQRTEVNQYQFQYQPLKPQFNIHSQQQFLTQEQASEEPLQEIIQDSRRLAPLTPPPPPPPAQPSIQQRLGPILPPPRPLPIPQPQPLRQDFDTQEYEPPTQQTYEPLQESTPKCECQKAEQSVSYPIKGSQSAPAPVKGGRLSPAKRNINSFLPQAFRTRRDSNAGTDSAKP